MITRLLIVLLSVSAMLTTPAGNAQLRPQIIKLEPYMGSALAMHLDVNGHEGFFLFHTGEGVSIITPEFAKTVGCTPWGKITGFRMTGQRMDFPHCDGLDLTTGATHSDASTLGVLDLAKLLPPDAPMQERTAIHTSAAGLTAGYVRVPAADRTIPAYFAHPEGRPECPTILVGSEAFGLHEHSADITRRLAHEGLFAIAPDLMIRQGDPASFSDVPTLVHELLLQIPDEQVMADLDAALRWVESRGGIADQRGIIGFCWGGRWVWLYAAHRRLNAAVSWYGIS